MVPILRKLAVGTVALAVLGGCTSSEKKDQAGSASTTSVAVGAAPTSTVRPVDTSFTGQNSTQFCALAKTYNERFSGVGSASTPAQLRTATQEGRTAITQAATAAPAEIKSDVQVVANAFIALISELEKANFDIAKVSPTSLAGLQAPEFQASTVRFQAYLRGICGITG